MCILFGRRILLKIQHGGLLCVLPRVYSCVVISSLPPRCCCCCCCWCWCSCDRASTPTSSENTVCNLRLTSGSSLGDGAVVSTPSVAAAVPTTGAAAAAAALEARRAGADDQRGRQATFGDGLTTTRRTSAYSTVVSIAARADCWNNLLRRVRWIYVQPLVIIIIVIVPYLQRQIDNASQCPLKKNRLLSVL